MTTPGLRGSVRLRLTLWHAGALTLALLLYAGLALGFLRDRLSHDVNMLLEQDITVAGAMLEIDNGKAHWERHDNDAPEARVARPWVEVLDSKGQVLFRALELEQELRGGEPMRWLDRRTTIDEKQVTIRAARSLRPMRRELAELALGLGLGLPLAVGFAGGFGYLLAKRALAPIGRMAESARAITAERLHARLAVANPRDELGQLATVFNQTLDRLERSFDQLRRFTADASHELRTPLTALRSVGEVGLRMERSPQAYREIVGSMLEEVDRLTRLIDSLLTLSRADGGQARLERVEVDLGALAAEVVQQMEVLAEEKGQALTLDAQPGLGARADRLVLRQALTNLIDNAIKYSPAGGRIDVVVRADATQRELSVADQGPGVPPHERDRIFERFYRIDKNRSRELGGVGLGLAIARWGVEAHGGRIELTDAPAGGSLFRMFIPRG
jgi:heavy metal sensor kinase